MLNNFQICNKITIIALWIGFLAIRVNRFTKISDFLRKKSFTKYFACFRISFERDKCENFRFFCEISLWSALWNNWKFSRKRIAKIARKKIRKFLGKKCKTFAKKNGREIINLHKFLCAMCCSYNTYGFCGIFFPANLFFPKFCIFRLIHSKEKMRNLRKRFVKNERKFSRNFLSLETLVIIWTFHVNLRQENCWILTIFFFLSCCLNP